MQPSGTHIQPQQQYVVAVQQQPNQSQQNNYYIMSPQQQQIAWGNAPNQISCVMQQQNVLFLK
jgi:hypothetical protein